MIKKDYLPKHHEISIYQDDEMFQINTDTMVLGEFLNIYKNDIVLDIGTNTGALLLYASRFNPKKLVGIDINQKALDLAKKNMEENNINNYELINADANTFKYDIEFDCIICNPPYFKSREQDRGENEYKRLAKHEENLKLESLINTISKNLKNYGTLYFLFQSTRLDQVILELEKNKIHVKELKFVFDKNKENSNVVLIKAQKGGVKGMNVKKSVIIDRE